MLRNKTSYRAQFAQTYEQQFRDREVNHLMRKAKKLGFTVQPVPA